MKKKPLIGVAIVLLAAALAGYLLLKPETEPLPAVEEATVAVPPAAAPEPVATAGVVPVIAHPLAEESAAATLPEGENADAALHDALRKVLSKKLLVVVVPDELIRHLVLTIDALPRPHLPAAVVPLKRAAGPFLTRGSGETLVIDGDNARRYTGYAELIKAVDAESLVAVYRRFYPLFQQAYGQLGYPGAYFNDRLVVAIDDLLAAPEPDTPIALTQTKVLYDYADPELQARSAGQKILIRLGRDNAAPVKAKLREIRRLLARTR